MKKGTKIGVAALCCALGLSALTACGGDSESDNKLTVKFMDGDTTISSVKVESGATVSAPETDPTKAGYDFVRWCATPNFSKPYDFNTEVTKDTSIFAGFRSQAEDDRTWYVMGESAVSSVFKFGWKTIQQQATAETPAEDIEIPDSIKFTQDAQKKNKFTLQLALYEGDSFQFVNSAQGWNGQVGYGFIDPAQYSSSTTANFYAVGSPYSDAVKKSNITCGVSGTYTFELYVDMDDKLTEFHWTRDGDAPELAVEYNYYIKGNKITDWTDLSVGYTQFATEDNKTYTLTIGMLENDEFMFNQIKIGDKTGKATGLNTSRFEVGTDEDTAAAIDSTNTNFKIKGGTGTYTFTIVEQEEGKPTLTAEKTADTVPAYDYYVKGSIGGDTMWSERHAMTLDNDTGMYKYTVNIAKDEQFQVTVAEAGDEEKTEVFNVGTAYANKKKMSNQIDTSTNNYKATAADNFTIYLNPVNLMVYVVGENDEIEFGVAVKGNFTNWAPSANEDEFFTISNKAQTLTDTITVELEKENEFMFISYKTSDPQKSQVGYANAIHSGLTLCAGLQSGGANIKCTTAGTYVFTITIDADGNFVTITVAKQ